MPTDTPDQISEVEHFVGGRLSDVRIYLEESGNPEEIRAKLFFQLSRSKLLKDSPLAKWCLDDLGRFQWKTSEDIDNFQQRYENNLKDYENNLKDYQNAN